MSSEKPLLVPSTNGLPPMLDVSKLPESAFDWRDPVWWGNTLLIMIETVTMSIAIAGYFYIRRNFAVFPPPKVDISPPVFNTEPRLMWGTINLALMIVGCGLTYVTDQYSRRQRRTPVLIGLIVMVLIGVATCAIRYGEFHAVVFWWNDNAYASIVWLILGTHATYLLAATIEFCVMLSWVVLRDLDEHHALDVTLCGGYWYWTAGVYVIVYGVIYFGPRLMGSQ